MRLIAALSTILLLLTCAPAVAGIDAWSTTAANNNSAPPNGAPEGMAPSTVNNVMRQNMASVRAWYEDAQWLNFGYTAVYASGTSFTVVLTDATSVYSVGRRIKAIGTLTGTIYGTIASSSFSTDTTVTVAWDSGSLSSESLTISVGALTHSATSVPAFDDTRIIVRGSADKSKSIRFEVDGLTTATTRVITVPDSDITLSGPSTTETLTNKTISGASNTLTTNHKVVNGTFDTATGSGTLSITGAGFTPTWYAIEMTGTSEGGRWSSGWSDGSSQHVAYRNVGSGNYGSTTAHVMLVQDVAGTTQHLFAHSAFTSDGVNLTTTKVGSPTGSINYSVRFGR